jgi:serine/threonine protein phosphatase PrpC
LSSGSTACVVIIQNRSLYCANLGDSRAVLCRKHCANTHLEEHRGPCLASTTDFACVPVLPLWSAVRTGKRKAVALCVDQNTGSESEQERVVKDGGYIEWDGEDYRVGNILCVTRAVGDYDVGKGEKLRGISATPVVTTFVLDDDDEFMLLACDGLWDVFSAQSAVDFARRMLVQEHAPEVVCEGLVAEALKRGSTDNVSVLLVRLGSKPIAAGTGRVGSGPRAKAMGSQRAVDATLPEDELMAKALELKRQGKYIPMHLKRYLTK